MNRQIRWILPGMVSAALAGCTAHTPSSGSSSGKGNESASSAALSASAPGLSPKAPEAGEAEAEERIAAIRIAEHTRTAELVLGADMQSRNVRVRRTAAKALARIGGDTARTGLLRMLSDEDGDVVAWAAYGLGFFCKGKESETVSALAARAASLIEPKENAASGKLDPSTAIARAIGRCAADTSEETLRAWLLGDRKWAVPAALGLGDLVAQKKKLLEETWVSLLGLAAGNASSQPAVIALFAFGRADNVPPSVKSRLLSVASARLAEASPFRLFAVRALSRAGQEAAPELARVLSTSAVFSAAERAEAARHLKRLGDVGQKALIEALPALVPQPSAIAQATLIGDELSVLLTVIESLDAPSKARPALTEMAKLAAPPQAPPALVRRLSWIRCLSAKVLAGANHQDPLLSGCDLGGGDGSSPGPAIGARAMVDVLGRGNLTGARYRAWLEIAMRGELRARERALEIIAEHEELQDLVPVLTAALGAKELGLVGTAADVIAKHPARAAEPAKQRSKQGKKKKGRDKNGEAEQNSDSIAVPVPSPDVVKALLAALAPPASGFAEAEVIDSLIDAAGALAMADALPRLTQLCQSPYPTTREHAEKAIGLVAPGKKASCPAPAQGGPRPSELSALVQQPLKLVFDTDVGELSMTLDPDIAPVTVTRIADLVRSGYYKNMVVHRVVPAFVTQFGAPLGDGFGGPPDKAPLRCETSPLPFEHLRVGMALAGRDTGSSQLFVMHGYAPHLDGAYALLGTAAGAWSAFVDGDRIRDVKIVP